MEYFFNGSWFHWDDHKAKKNHEKHGVTFPEACEVFDDPFYHMEAAGAEAEERWLILGYSTRQRLLAVVAAAPEEQAWRIISARPATPGERQKYEEDDSN
ncbi:MAG: BrnT family toxin [Thermodesulfobacteriota bacterium]